ncbi:MAG: hypothetical protein U0787_00205 [Polyangia bacterium]
MLVSPWRTASRVGLSLCLFLGVSGAALAKKKDKGPPPVQHDPLETELNPQPPSNPSDGSTGSGANSGGSSGSSSSGGSGGSSSGGSSSGGSSSGGSSSGNSSGSAGAPATGKIGRYMVSLKLGAAPCVYFSGGCSTLHQGVVGAEFAWALTPSAAAYLIVPIQVQFRQSVGTLMIPVGIQYDIGLPVPNLYIYPRISLGYAALLVGAAGSLIADHFGVAIPEVGLKYVFSGRYHLGGEVVSLPVFFSSSTVLVHYRAALSFGVSF